MKQSLIEQEVWTKEHITKAAKIFLNAEKNKSTFIKLLDQVVHWMVILLILFGNTLISIFIVFISGILSPFFFYGVTAIAAVCFGLLIEIPIKDMEKLDKNKHFLSRLALPLLALVNIYILIGVKSVIDYYSKVRFEFNPLVVGIIYGILFLLPHTITLIRSRKKR
jgi:hypothetical protein